MEMIIVCFSLTVSLEPTDYSEFHKIDHHFSRIIQAVSTVNMGELHIDILQDT
jgi:hypothetical protein